MDPEDIVGYIVANGDPFSGLILTGPFESQIEAERSEEFNNGSDAWIVPIYKPQ